MEGGRGGGKTMALLWEAIINCLRVDGCNCLLLRRTLTAVEKGGIEDHFTKYVPRQLYRRYNSTKHIVTFGNGSKLFFGHIKSDRDLLQYQGAEFLFIGWEELTQFTYRQWDFLKGSNRCPIKTDIFGRPTKARMGGGTNPNGKGAQWVKALWITKKPPAGEMSINYDPAEYEAIHSTYLDNPTYANDIDYIRKLQGISDPYLRAAWIPGDWSALSGQYFSNWETEWSEKKRRWIGRHVRNIKEVKFLPWEERWIAIDWGFEHHCVILWFTRVQTTDGFGRERNVICVYRELVLRRMNEELIAQGIGTRNVTGDVPDKIAAVYLSPDRFSRINSEHSIAEVMGDVLREYEIPRPERANNDRVDGWRLIYTLLDTENLIVLDTCTDTIESIPKLMRDDKNPEDAEKEGNELFLDVCESLRYGCMSYASKAPIPDEVKLEERLMKIKDPTSRYMEYLRLTSKPPSSDVLLDIPGRLPPGRRAN